MGLGLSYCGIPATQRMQDYFLWEKILNENPDVDGIVELGTAYGGFSLFLKHQAAMRGIQFTTFDNVDHSQDDIGELFGQPGKRRPTAHRYLGIRFQKVDILNQPWLVGKALSYLKRPILFCDNGSKKEEVKLFAPRLPHGSILIVHDWLDEIGPKDIPYYFSEIYGQFCDHINSWSRVFRK